jgi:hypothetical protein
MVLEVLIGAVLAASGGTVWWLIQDNKRVRVAEAEEQRRRRLEFEKFVLGELKTKPLSQFAAMFSPTNLRHFIRTRKLDPMAPEIPVRTRRP